MIDLSKIKHKYRIYKAEEGKHSQDPTYLELRGRSYSNHGFEDLYNHIYPWSDTLLAAYVIGRRSLVKMVEFAEVKQLGSHGKFREATVVFLPEHLKKAGKILKIYTNRMANMTKEEKKRLTEQLQRARKARKIEGPS